MLKGKRKIAISFFNLLLTAIMLFSSNILSVKGAGRYYPTLSYAICKCDKSCEKCMIKDENSQDESNVHCKFQGVSACECRCNFIKLASFSTDNSHIWTDKKSAVIKAILRDKKNKVVNEKYVQIGKTPSNDKVKTERNCYYYIIGKKNKSGKIVYDNSKRRIGQYYIQELFELNRLTEKKYKLYITLPKTNLYTNGYYRIFGNTTFDGSGCIITKTNDNPFIINFDDTDSNTVKYSGSSNITVKNMTVDCTDKSDGTINHYRNGFFYMAHCSNVVVDHIVVKNGRYNGHVFQITGARNVTVSDSKFYNLLYINRNTNKRYTRENCGNRKEKNSEYYGNTLFNYEVIQIEPDFSNTNNGTAFALPTIKMSNDDTVSKDVTIEFCRFENVMRAIGNHSTKVKICNRITIYNNIFVNTIGHAVILPRYNYVTVCNNIFNKISTKQVGGSLVYYGKYIEANTMNVYENLMFNVYNGCNQINVVDYWGKSHTKIDDNSNTNTDTTK